MRFLSGLIFTTKILLSVGLVVFLSLSVGVLLGELQMPEVSNSILGLTFGLIGLQLFMLGLLVLNVKLVRLFPSLQKTERELLEEENYYNRKRW